MLDYVETLVTVLLVEAILIIPLGIAIVAFRNRLKNVFFTWASEFKNLTIAEMIENPAITTKILAPMLKTLAKEYGVPEPGTTGGGNINLFGLKLPRSIVEMVLPAIINKGAQKALESSGFG